MNPGDIVTLSFMAGAAVGFIAAVWLAWAHQRDRETLALQSGHIVIRGRVFSERKPGRR